MKKQHKRRRFWGIVIVLVAAVLLGAYLLLLRPPTGPIRITVSKETTHIPGPVNEDGTVNYVAYLNAKHSRGVTKENNAAIPLIEIIGPDILPQDDIIEMCRKLKIEPPSETGKYFISLEGYIKKTRGEGHWETQADKDELDKTSSAPWKAQNHPMIDGWLKTNGAALNATCVAMERTGFYMPAVASGRNVSMISICMPDVITYLGIGRALTARAMLRINSGDMTGGWTDLMAARHLARRVGNTYRLVASLVAIAIEVTACSASRAMAGSGELTGDQARALLADMQQFNRLPDLVNTIDEGERFMALDCVMLLARTSREMGVEKALDKVMLGKEVEKSPIVLSPRSLRWDKVLRRMNPWYDRLVTASRHKTFKVRAEALADHDRAAELFRANLGRPHGFLQSVSWHFSDPSESIGDTLASLLLPSISGAIILRDQATAEGDLTIVTMALAAYRAEKQAYPDNLAQLTPGYLKKVPNDLFSDESFSYTKTDKGYLLYSVGENMKYDGPKKNEDDETDDIVVEVE